MLFFPSFLFFPSNSLCFSYSLTFFLSLKLPCLNYFPRFLLPAGIASSFFFCNIFLPLSFLPFIFSLHFHSIWLKFLCLSSCLPILTSRLSCFPQSSSYLLLSLPPFLSFIVSLHFTPCIIYPSLHSVVFFISLFFSHYPMLPLYLPIRPLLRNEISLMIMECVILINFILCCFLKHPIDGAVAHD